MVNSTIEIKYIVASDATKEAIWIKKFIIELGIILALQTQWISIVITMEPLTSQET